MNSLLRRLGSGFALLGSLLAAAPLAGAGAEEFVPLFNGRDLSGWVNVNCAPETFVVRDGMIHCDGVPTGALRTTRQYENFILELDWRHLVPAGNAGVFIWASPLPAPGQPFLRAVEVQVLDHGYGQSDWFTTHGDVFPIHGSSMKPFSPSKGDRSFPKEKRSHPSPEWNHYRVVATNGVLRLSVNGAEVSGGTNCNWRKGFIGLESEGGTVDWRNLRIQELPSTGATAEQSAPPAEAWRSLYDGRGFRGWTLPKDQPGVWTNADWNLRSTTTAAPGAILWANDSLNPEEWFFDWRWDGKTSERIPPLALRFGDEPNPIPLPPLSAARADGWNRLHLRRRGTTVDLVLNGAAAGTVSVPTGPFRLGLRPGGVPILFGNVFVK